MNPSSNTSTRPWLLISDVDDTLTGDAAGLIALTPRLPATATVSGLRSIPAVPRQAFCGRCAMFFPKPWFPMRSLPRWARRFRWAASRLRAGREKFADWPQPEIHALLLSLGHRPHDDEFQTPYKVSFAVEGIEAQAEAARRYRAPGLKCQ